MTNGAKLKTTMERVVAEYAKLPAWMKLPQPHNCVRECRSVRPEGCTVKDKVIPS